MLQFSLYNYSYAYILVKGRIIITGAKADAGKHSLKIKEEFKNLKKHKIQNIFTKMKQIKLVFSMIWFMEILKI